MCLILVKEYSAYLKLGHFPASWKKADIILLNKEGKDLSTLKGYKLIFLLLIIVKKLEKLVAKCIVSMCDEYSVLYIN